MKKKYIRVSEIKTKVPNKYRSRLYVGYETPVPRQMMLRFELSINNGKRCKERVKKESKCDLRVFDPIGRNLLNGINRAEEWLPVEEQEVPNEMGNTVYLPLFSVIWSFIAVRSVACFFLSFSLPGWVPCETFVVRLVSYCRRVSLTKMWSRFIYHWTFGHNAHSHIGSHVDFFKRVIYFLFHCCFQPNGKKITGYFCARRTFIGSQRANKQLKYNDKRSDTNEKTTNVLLLEPIE